MAIGTEENIEDALMALVSLDYDAIEAYQAAIDRLEDEAYKTKLEQFKGDHHRHVEELSLIIRSRGKVPPQGPDIKRLLTKGKVVIGGLIGDRAILLAMKSNESETNLAYETMNKRDDLWPELEQTLLRGLHDEKRHKAWLEYILNAFPNADS